MAETIYTIPINEAFDKYDGCPLCRLHRDLENASLEYVMGAAMMEPDVRIETNRLGFCRKHFDHMLQMKNRLSLALMLESHLAEIDRLLQNPADGGKKRFAAKKDAPMPGDMLLTAADSCYVCRRVSGFEQKYLSNVIHLWKTDESFRMKFAQQPWFCLEHGGALLNAAGKELDAKRFAVFQAALISVLRSRTDRLKEDLSAFTQSFDHRHAGKPLTEQARSSVENVIAFVSGETNPIK